MYFLRQVHYPSIGHRSFCQNLALQHVRNDNGHS